MGAALLIQPDGELTDVSVAGTATNVLLNCRVATVAALTTRIDMWTNDEALYEGSFNPIATALAHQFGFAGQRYHGPALLCGVNEQGDSVDLDIAQVRALLTHLADL